MTLPASGPISMLQVAAEIGISHIGLSLNHANVRTLAGVPSGVISFANLHGKSWLAVVLNAHTISSVNTGAVPAGITVTFQNNGLLAWSRSGQSPVNGDFSGEWLNQIVASTVADDYEVRATLSSGSTPSSGTMSSWLNLGTSRSWSNNIGADAGTKTSTILFEIRRASDGVVLDSATITIFATSSSA
jgi:hypothetical protein